MTTNSKKERATFNLLWDMVNEVQKGETYRGRSQSGTIISRYASMIDDRIENSGYSRSVGSQNYTLPSNLKKN